MQAQPGATHAGNGSAATAGALETRLRPPSISKPSQQATEFDSTMSERSSAVSPHRV